MTWPLFYLGMLSEGVIAGAAAAILRPGGRWLEREVSSQRAEQEDGMSLRPQRCR